MTTLKLAIKLLRSHHVPVVERAYGFALMSSEDGKDFAHCGIDNDGSTSLSVDIGDSNPVRWFFRVSYLEMAEFLVKVYHATGHVAEYETGLAIPSKKELMSTMSILNEDYDESALEKLTSEFLGELDFEAE